MKEAVMLQINEGDFPCEGIEARENGARPKESNENAMEEQAVEDPEVEAIKTKVIEMEEELKKLKEMQSEVDSQMSVNPSGEVLKLSAEEKMEADGRSVFVGNVDYGSTTEELVQHFRGCGPINRITILCNKYSGHPKGFAYIEFADKDSVETAMALDESVFRGREIKIMPKRTNHPRFSAANRVPRGRYRGGFGRSYGRGRPDYGYRPSRRPYRSRRAAMYRPY